MVKTKAELKHAKREFHEALQGLEGEVARIRQLAGSCLGFANHVHRMSALQQRRNTVGVCALCLWHFGTSCGVRAQADERLAHSTHDAFIVKMAELDVVATIIKRAVESTTDAQDA